VALAAHGLDRLDRRAAGGHDVLDDQAALAAFAATAAPSAFA
jgi:hypothetical protein